MRINISGRGLEVDGALDAHIRRRVSFVAGRFSTRVRRVNVTLTSANGTRDGRDKTCRIHVPLLGLPAVSVEHMDTDMHAAIDYSIGHLGRTLARKICLAPASIHDKRAGQ